MWKPLSAIDRRVIGVLVEKAKTTPEQYPLTVNSIVTGSNQKNNRYPQMELDSDDVTESLDRLRGLGAITEVQGSGRALKYRHMMYEWLGVEKVELGVMAELLLRGAQTEGELRGRAARMDPIADVAALRPILDSLKAKNLIVSLTSAGRGHVLTHALYEPQEMEKLRREFHAAAAETTHHGPTTAAPAHHSSSVASASPQTAPSVALPSALQRSRNQISRGSSQQRDRRSRRGSRPRSRLAPRRSEPTPPRPRRTNRAPPPHR